MIGLGTIINTMAIVAGGLIGMAFGKALKQRFQDSLIMACGLSTMFIGASGALAKIFAIADGALTTTGSLMLIASLCFGGLAGELLDIEGNLERFGEWLKVKSRSERDPRFIEGFTTASFTVCIGAMAVIGPINDALYHDYTLLITKAILDFVIVMAMASSLGRGTVFSAVPLFLFQGAMTLLAGLLAPVMTPAALSCISLVGNVLIFCVGLNLCVGKRVKVANYLPALIIAVVWSALGITL